MIQSAIPPGHMAASFELRVQPKPPPEAGRPASARTTEPVAEYCARPRCLGALVRAVRCPGADDARAPHTAQTVAASRLRSDSSATGVADSSESGREQCLIDAARSR